MNRRKILARCLVAALLLWASIFSRAAYAADPGDLVVMTYNLRYASNSKPNSWPERRPAAVAMIHAEQPDLVGTQEGLFHQLKDLASDLPQYAWIGLGRDGGSHGEFMAIFYRADRFDVLEYDHYWLSDTPEVIGSTTWGNSNRRMVTWVRFKDRRTERTFYFLNTHLDHQVQTAREKSVDLILNRMAKLDPELPLIMTADFNAAAGKNPVYDILVGTNRLQDTWTAAAERGPEVGTFHNYRGPSPGGARIDWILTRGGLDVLETHVVTFALEGQFPSDHFPLVARLRLQGK